jgi:hypothetical protein
MATSPEHDRPHDPPQKAIASGVRTEHELRTLLRGALERNTRFERALREATAFAYGRRDLADLRKLRAVLSAAGFHDPNAKRPITDDDEPAPPARG